MQDFKLANVLVDIDDFLIGHEDLFYRSHQATYDSSTQKLSWSGTIDFLTYFNALPVEKWHRYTGIDRIWLHVEVQGSCTLTLYACTSEQSRTVVDTIEFESSSSMVSRDIAIPMQGVILAGFSLSSNQTAQLGQAYYFAKVDAKDIRPINLALCTTTFKKEEFILPNIDLIKHKVLASDEAIAQHLHLFVVDNGRTLDAKGISDEGVTVCPNDNVGGSGGFARGMIEAQRSSIDFTHVLLMDDDVRVSPESFKRTFNLLSLAKGRYAHAFINGAMLELGHPNVQFEDVSFVRRSGGYAKFKPTLDVSKIEGLIKNETVSVESDRSYGAWWYSCIPMEAIAEHGLPMPFFVRGDDVEYGLRCHPTYMVMGGVCVWHAQFVGRFRASVDAYQYVRNMLALMAVDGGSSRKAFMARFWRVFHIYMRTMNYNAAGLWLDGLDDFMKGPDFLATADGSRLMKENGAKNEKLVPIDQLDQSVMKQITIHKEWLGHADTSHGVAWRMLESLPHDRHWLPDWMLIDAPQMIDYSGNLGPWNKVACRRTLVALDATGEHGHIRVLDRSRYRHLMDRYHRSMKEYHHRHAEVEQAYRDAAPKLTSLEFWDSYLHLTK
ncbi:MAG: glycosyltransferase [Eggerthellaceae bacterium]|jgi:GT2 family glycosyltransferase|nr:glycosyltransferase [Eggerthellaceae bacterium]MCH4220379.1 glycosyltransferase [Eggerthellaceae bacterium]